jgi:nucleoside-diphosphate-sugar epimerase
MNLFITGSNGYLGRNLIYRLSQKQNKIYALTRKKKNPKYKNVKWLIGSIDKKWPELAKSDILIHLAAEGVKNLYSDFDKCYSLNVVKSKKLILNAYESGCKKWLIITTCKEKKVEKYKNYYNEFVNLKKVPFFYYGLTKKTFTNFCLNFCKQKKIKCRVIRLFQIYGGIEPKKRLWPSLIRAIKKNDSLLISKGVQKQDFCNINFVIDEIEKSLNFNYKSNNFPQEWDMGTGKSISVKKFVKEFCRKFNLKIKILISKSKDYDSFNYFADKSNLWKIKSEI